MDFKSFIIGLVVGIFGPYMDESILTRNRSYQR